MRRWPVQWLFTGIFPAIFLLLFVVGARPGRAGDALPAERQILVMLHLPPPHYRPGGSYGSSYDDQAGRLARRRVAEKLARQYGLTLLNDWPMPALGVDCYVMKISPGQAVVDVAKDVSADPRTEWVQPLNAFHTLGHQDPLYSVQPSATLWQLDDLHKVSIGRGVSIAVVDSGVEADHPDLAGQVSVQQNFVDARTRVAESHGTEVAGIIAARADNGMGMVGIAPQASLMALRACWEVSAERTLCNSFTLAKALQFAIDGGARVINLSLSGPDDKLLGLLLDVALAHGATVVAAVDPDAAGGGFPASHPGVLAVSASPPHASALATQAFAQWPVLMAPGRDIPTTAPGARWTFVSGPSFAAAHVSGMVALVKQLTPEATMRDRDSWAIFPAAAADGLAGTIDACSTLRRATSTWQCANVTDRATRASW
ncbi:MAG: S8 family serine peptidase [Rudaea sp.]|nr:S8 family serine peptidase [Rudaea sp.]